MEFVKPLLNPEEQAELSAFLTRKIKEFDPEKGTLGFWIQSNVWWWLDKLTKGEMRE